jgi:hypothetical protein
MRHLYRVQCLGCLKFFRAITVERLGLKVAAHKCWEQRDG